MAGIHFDITGDNRNFIEAINQIQARVKQTSSVLAEVGKNFNVSGVTNQIIALTKVIQEQENKIRAAKDDIVSMMEEANDYRNKGDNSKFEYTQKVIEQETKKLGGYVNKLKEYKQALDDIMTANGRETGAKAPMFFADMSQFDAYEELLRKREELQSKIANFNNEGMNESQATARIVEMRSALTALNTEINNTELAAAKAASALGENGQKASEAAVNYYTLTKAVEEQISKVNDLEAETLEAYNSFQASVEIGDVEGASNAQAEYENLKETLHSARIELINLQNDQKTAENTFRQFGDTSSSLRMQLREITMELQNLTLEYRMMSSEERNSAKGQEMKKKIEELTDKAGELKDAFIDVQKAISSTASDTSAFDAIAGGINVVTSSFGAATGVAAMFGVEEEDLLDIQAKLQASLAISNALTVIQTQLQKESALMIGINTIQKKAAVIAENLDTVAKGKNVIATTAATVAQKAFNLVAKANPYVLLATALITVVGALAAFTLGTKKSSKAEEEAKQKAEELREEHNRLFADYNRNVGKLKTSYMELQTQWNSLSSDQERAKWVTENKDKFAELGLKVNNVKDAEAVLVANTSAVIQSMVLRAKAAYQAAQAQAAYERALNGKIDESTRTVNAEQARWMQSKGYQVKERGNGLWFAEAEGIKAYNAALESFADMNFTKAQYGIMDLNNEADELLGKYKKTKEEVTKSTGGKKDNTAKEEGDRQAKEKQQEWKHEEEMRKLKQDADRALEDASIADIQSQAERERRERESQHRRSLEDIEAQEDEIYKVIYEKRKEAYEIAHKNDKNGGHYENDALGELGWQGVKGTLTEGEQAYFDKRYEIIKASLDKENTEYNRWFEENLRKQEKENNDILYEYLEKFGDYNQQRFAIYEKANNEICELEKQLNAESNEDTRQAIQQKIELIKNGVKQQEEALDQKFGKTPAILGDLFGDASKKGVKDISKLIDKYRAFLDYKEGKRSRDDLKNVYGFTEEEIDGINGKLKTGELTIKELSDKVAELMNMFGNGSSLKEFAFKLKTLMQDARKAFEAGNGEKGWEHTSKAITMIGGKFDEAAGYVQAFGSVLQGCFDVDSSDIAQTVEGLKQVSGYITNIAQGAAQGGTAGAIVGFGMSVADILSKVQAQLDAEAQFMNQQERARLNNTIDAVKSSIDKLTETMGHGIDAIEKSIEINKKLSYLQEKYVEGLQASKGVMIQSPLAFMGDNYNTLTTARIVADRYGLDAWFGDRNYTLGKGFGSWQSILTNTDPEKLAEILYDIRENDFALWGEITSIEGAKEYFEALADTYMETADNIKKTQEMLTSTTSDDVFNNFMDKLYKMAGGAEDVFDEISDDWQDMVNKMVINNLVSNNFKKNLEEWYKKLAEVNKKRIEGAIDDAMYKNQLDQLKNEYNEYANNAKDEIEQLRSMGLVANTGENSDKKATYNVSDKVTYDQMDEFTGILRATQIAVEHGGVTRDLILANLETLSTLLTGNGVWAEMRNLIATSNDYLLDIKKSNRAMLDRFTERMDTIINKIDDLDI